MVAIAVPCIATALTCILAIASPRTASPLLLAPLVLSALVAIFTGLVVDRRHRQVEAELELLPGRVVVRDAAGSERTTLEARSIVGATTARLEGGVSLVLAQQPARSRPTVLRLANEADADAVRRALGIGPGGFGSLQWSAGRSRMYWARVFFRVTWRALVAFTVILGVLGLGVLGPTIIQLACYAGMAALGMRLTQGNDPPFVQVSSDGVVGHVRDVSGGWVPRRVPFDAIRSVAAKGASLVLDCAPPHGHVELAMARPDGMIGIDDEERAHIVAQIQAASERVRQPSQHEEKASRLEFLRRGEHESWQVWLARLDALAQSLKGAHNYRALALDEADLWSALETPEVEPELRTAAARVLARAEEPETRQRIETTLAAERDPAALKQIRVALEPDAEEAVRELEHLERRATARR